MKSGVKMNELISIIIPVYNSKDNINRCLDSLINQSYKNIEILIIDDGSSDGSEYICDCYASNYNNVRCIHLKNGGVSNARNVGLKLSKGKYIGFVDSDDYVSEKMFEELYRLLHLDNNYDMAVCEGYSRRKKGIDILNSEDAIYQLFNINGFGGFVWNKLYKKEIIDLLKLEFSTEIHMCEDLLFSYEYCKYSNNVIYTRDKLYFYIKNEESITNGNFKIKQITVVDAFNKILEESNMFSKKTISNIISNYILILIKISYKALLSENELDIKYYSYLKEIINKYFIVFLKNRNISIKYKLYSFVIMYLPSLLKLCVKWRSVC